MKSIDDFDYDSKTVLLRVDINSPLDPQTKRIINENRLQKSIPTISKILQKGARLAIIAHQGDTLDYQNLISLEEHAEKLTGYLGVDVDYVDDVCGPAAQDKVRSLQPGQAVLLGNLRYLSEEISTFENAVKLKPDEISTVSGREVFRLRDNVIPLISLSEATGLTTGTRNMEEEIHVVVARVGDRLAGFAVDALNEPQEFVVKSLGEYVGGARGVSGASILGDGRVVLIMDIPTLITGVGMRSRKIDRERDAELFGDSELSELAEIEEAENELKQIQALRELEAEQQDEPTEDAA